MCTSNGVTIVRAGTLEDKVPPQSQAGGEAQYGLQSHTVLRIDLHAALLALARSPQGDGPRVRFVVETQVVVYEPGSGSIILEGGRKVVADLVVAADGVHSKARSYIVEHCPASDYTGCCIFRFAVSMKEVSRTT
ncbi:hypothetical protein BAUCODRAFT_459647 [Baudoinia panamericana UAMH 10762]|uniref:FAD-binding domain-containing protein n=1 Tax=Baudoinia panamericana (strain UAMH 10762) TaxID=717646 RepID=M2NEF1_BAUPA|nr:uncharacterized protein BAUCODRAFT_459647 [Baudoinia panamericana UAMH 10762]EMC97609.1 hypothetical protein BAUCODRAFT_459647 [Baudoinia panamericana UAMH 10762]